MLSTEELPESELHIVEIQHQEFYKHNGSSPIPQQPLVGQGLLIIEASRSHSGTPHSEGLLWTSDQPDAETSN
jgi:hypothetical protein